MNIRAISALSHIWMYKNFDKMGISLEYFGRASRKFTSKCHNKFHLYDLKTVGGVWDTTFHQWTNRCLTDSLLTRVHPLAHNSITWVYKYLQEMNLVPVFVLPSIQHAYHIIKFAKCMHEKDEGILYVSPSKL